MKHRPLAPLVLAPLVLAPLVLAPLVLAGLALAAATAPGEAVAASLTPAPAAAAPAPEGPAPGALALTGETPSPAAPIPQPLHIIGGPNTGGCIAGAVSLPPEGPGFQTIHPDRSAFWGAPQTIANLKLLGRQAAQAGLPPLLIEDISRPKGGPLPGGHVSHQLGLDADVGLDTHPHPPLSDAGRDTVTLRGMVRPDGRDIDPGAWSPRVITLLRLAAALPEVDRILVNPAIKRQLCREVTGDRTWLTLIRPWYGHAAHMHIRFRCPAGQADCVQAAPPPPGDGCDATLQWWFDQLDAPPKPSAPYRPPPPPAACNAILTGH